MSDVLLSGIVSKHKKSTKQPSSTDEIRVGKVKRLKSDVDLQRLSKPKTSAVTHFVSIKSKNFQWCIRLQTPFITASSLINKTKQKNVDNSRVYSHTCGQHPQPTPRRTAIEFIHCKQ